MMSHLISVRRLSKFEGKKCLSNPVEPGSVECSLSPFCIRAGQAITDNCLYFSGLTNFENIKKIKTQFFLSSTSTSNSGITYFPTSGTERDKNKKVTPHIALGVNPKFDV